MLYQHIKLEGFKADKACTASVSDGFKTNQSHRMYDTHWGVGWHCGVTKFTNCAQRTMHNANSERPK